MGKMGNFLNDRLGYGVIARSPVNFEILKLQNAISSKLIVIFMVVSILDSKKTLFQKGTVNILIFGTPIMEIEIDGLTYFSWS